MGTTPEALSRRQQDYFVAQWVDGQLEMEPYCHCGTQLDEHYYCETCQRQCECSFVLCRDAQTLQVVQKFIQGNPSFQNFSADLLDQN